MTTNKSFKNTDFINAIDKGNYVLLKKLIQDINNIDTEVIREIGNIKNPRYMRHENALLVACKDNCSDKVVKILLDARANSNACSIGFSRNSVRDDHRIACEFPLFYACKNNNKKVIKLLLENKAEVNSNFLGETPFMFLWENLKEEIEENEPYKRIGFGIPLDVVTVDTEIIKLFIEKKVSVKYHSSVDYKTTHFGCISDEICKKLYELKSISNFFDDNNYEEQKNKHIEVLTEILKLIVEKCVDVNMNSILKEVYEAEDKEFMKFILKNGADQNSIYKEEKTFVEHAKYVRKEWFVLLSQKEHSPKELAEILQKLSLNEKLKYSNHTWDSGLKYSDFMKNLEDGFREIGSELENLSPSLYQDIQKILFLEDDAKAITWSSEIIKEEIEKGTLPHNISLDISNQSFKTFGDAIDDFKSLFVVKQNDKKLKLLKKFTKIKKELGLKNIDLNDLKKDKIDKFFTDTKRFEKALTLILKDIQENSNDDKKDIVVEADTISVNGSDMIEIKIIHIGSTSPKTAEALNETIDKNGGNFQTIYSNLLSVCDWSIDTICQDKKRYSIDYLYPEIDNTKPHCTQIDDESRGFTHILKFYI